MAASPHSWDFLLLRLRELRLPLSRETRRIASNDLERRREFSRIIRHLGSGITATTESVSLCEQMKS